MAINTNKYYNEDIICKLTEDLTILSMTTLLSSCKTFYNMRKEYVKNNKTSKEYSQYDNSASYINILVNSNIGINNYPLLTNTPNNVPLPVQIRNTFKLMMFNHSKDKKDAISTYNRTIVHNYCTNMIFKMLGYKRLTSCDWCLSILYDIHWYESNICIYDYYQLMYLFKKRNFRKMEELLLNIQFTNQKQYILSTLAITMKLFDSIDNQYIRMIIVCLIYAYIDYIINELFENYLEKNIKLIKTFVEKGHQLSDQISDQISENKKLPKYIINIIKNKITTAIKHILQNCKEYNIDADNIQL
jgi:hypothetical protein